MVLNRDAVLADRLKSLVAAWVATLPRGGWSGSPSDLANDLANLEAERRFFVAAPRARGVAAALQLAAAEIAAAGWQWSQRRTGRGRSIAISRLPSSVTQVAARS